MKTKKEVDEWYTDEYEGLLKWTMNKSGGGDRIRLEYEGAMDVVHSAYMYHAKHPEHLNPKYIYNKLRQLRINYIRDKDDMMDELSWEVEEEEDVSFEMEEVDKQLASYIEDVSNDRHRQILKEHLIDGEPIPSCEADKRMVVVRFRRMMKERLDEEGVRGRFRE